MTRHHGLIPAVLLALVPPFVAAESGAHAAASAAVGSVRSIRALPDELLRSRPLVSLQGVVTFHHPPSGLTYVQDADGGIELRGLSGSLELVPGKLVAVTGRVDDSRPIPGIKVDPGGLVMMEQGAPPSGVPLGAEAIRTGALDGRRVTMEAVLFSAELTAERGDPPWLRLNVASPSGHLTWLVPWSAGKALPVHLLHSKVRGTGVCEAIFNNRGQRIGILLFIGSLEEIEVIRPPVPDPFAKPTRSLAELMRPGLDDPVDRVRIEGVVLCQQQQKNLNLIHLRTNQGAIQVEVVNGQFEVGDRLAVVGYPVVDNKHVVMREAIASRLGREKGPEPLRLDVDELMSSGSDSDLVTIRGLVLRNGLEANQGSLFVESDERVVEVALSSFFGRSERTRMAHDLEVGAELELTGVADLQGPMLTTGTVILTDMKLTVRTPADIVIRRAPPWWTTGRLLALAGGLAAVLALISAWVILLRRRVAAQTVIIGEKIGREARWLERSRIARDIHDDVGSALTQITLLGDLGRRGGGEPQQANEQFERISSQAREAVRALDAIVWTVNPKNDSLPVTVSYLCQMVQDLTRDTGIRCRLEIPDEIPELGIGAKARHNLLLAVKEAVHNVIKHASAGVLRLRMEFGADDWRVEIADDGGGFDVAAADVTRTGLDSMRQRMADIEGRLVLESGPGQGTRVEFVIPWQALK